MWKESYCLGIQLIDKQHRSLFEMVEDLINITRGDSPWDEKRERCAKAVEFMKSYVVEHFRDEEAYQLAIGYCGYEEHKRQHADFTADVLEYEKKLIDSGFDRVILQQFEGMLLAWLIYHVANSDQKIAPGNQLQEKYKTEIPQCFIAAALDTLRKVSGAAMSQLSYRECTPEVTFGDLYIKGSSTGDIIGNVYLAFPNSFALNMLSAMTMMSITDMDDMVYSAMQKVADSFYGNAMGFLSGKYLNCSVSGAELCREPLSGKLCPLESCFIIDSPFGKALCALTF